MAAAADLLGIQAAVTCAAADPDAWQGVADALADAFPGARPNFLDYDITRGPGPVTYQARYEDDYLRSYHAHYRTVVPGFLT